MLNSGFFDVPFGLPLVGGGWFVDSDMVLVVGGQAGYNFLCDEQATAVKIFRARGSLIHS
jgi:hypothetical protein